MATVADRIVPDESIRGDRPWVLLVITLWAAASWRRECYLRLVCVPFVLD
jgi:hypothetical protein